MSNIYGLSLRYFEEEIEIQGIILNQFLITMDQIQI